MRTHTARFRLAPMNGVVRTLTVIVLLLPALFAALALQWPALWPAFAGLLAIYAWVWLRFRPSHFEVNPVSVVISWPLKRRELDRASISGVRLLDGPTLRRELGWALRIGVGGLWGGFGWLWTRRRGLVQFYISRTDQLVWIERGQQRPWLLTPERPEEFVAALARPEAGGA